MDPIITPAPFLDWQLIICLFALFGMAVAVIAYKVGICHGREAGYEAGRAEEITRHKPKIIAAKREAAGIARTLCLAELDKAISQQLHAKKKAQTSTNTQS